ncbi:MAG: hypothetical protein WCO23_04115 [bacterium]
MLRYTPLFRPFLEHLFGALLLVEFPEFGCATAVVAVTIDGCWPAIVNNSEIIHLEMIGFCYHPDVCAGLVSKLNVIVNTSP